MKAFETTVTIHNEHIEWKGDLNDLAAYMNEKYPGVYVNMFGCWLGTNSPHPAKTLDQCMAENGVKLVEMEEQ